MFFFCSVSPAKRRVARGYANEATPAHARIRDATEAENSTRLGNGAPPAALVRRASGALHRNTVQTRSPARGDCHMLVYLNEHSFDADTPVGVAFACNVRDAQAAGVPVLVVHEREAFRGGLAFDHFFQTTPADLVRGGLYRELAVPWHAGPHARVSHAVAAAAMGATRKMRGAVRERMEERQNMRKLAHAAKTSSQVVPAPAVENAASNVDFKLASVEVAGGDAEDDFEVLPIDGGEGVRVRVAPSP